MLELLLACALCVALYRSHRARRHVETAGATAALYLLVVDTANFVEAPFAELHPLHAFIFWLLGPGMWHHRGASGLPGAALLAATPWLARTARLVLSSIMAWRCSREAAQRGPLVPMHATLGWVAAPFYLAASADAFETLLFVLGQTLASAR